MKKLNLSLIVLLLFTSYISSYAFNCTNDNECLNGTCMTTRCKCNECYTNYNSDVCNYKTDSLKTFRILSLLPFTSLVGSGWFYIGEICLGLLMLFNFIIAVFGSIGVNRLLNMYEEKKVHEGSSIYYITDQELIDSTKPYPYNMLFDLGKSCQYIIPILCTIFWIIFIAYSFVIDKNNDGVFMCK